MNTSEVLSLEDLIKQAISKVGKKNELSISRFLPTPCGGYMHHFTMRKMMQKNPEELYKLIQRYIIQSENPKEIPPKLQDPQPSREKEKFFIITETEMNRIIDLAIRTQEDELLKIMRMRKVHYCDAEDQLTQNERHHHE